jgi:hypothetical protein
LPFSSEHKARFQELHAVGELHALNGHNENLDLGPWHLSCDLTDSDTADRLKARFRAAAQKVAMAAGAPHRVNRLDWWIGKLTHGKPLAFIQGLIQRSAEYSEELETRALEFGRSSTKLEGVGGLYRDRYACDWGEPYFLYDGPSRSFSDPKSEFEYWTEHIWSGFNGAIAKLDQIHGARKRRDKETRKEFKDRIGRRVDSLYACMQRSIRGLSYDLAVLQANYIIDRGLRGDQAIRAFQDESAGLIERVRTFGREGSKRLGLSYSRQEKAGVDPIKPFREVGEDLRQLTAASAVDPGLQPAPALDGGSGVVLDPAADQDIREQTATVEGAAGPREAVGEASRSQVSAPENAPLQILKTGKRRGRRPNQERRDAIRAAIRTHGNRWRDHLNDIFGELDRQEVPLGDFQSLKIDLGEGKSTPVSTWADLDLADGEQGRQIVDTLRKYTD